MKTFFICLVLLLAALFLFVGCKNRIGTEPSQVILEPFIVEWDFAIAPFPPVDATLWEQHPDWFFWTASIRWWDDGTDSPPSLGYGREPGIYNFDLTGVAVFAIPEGAKFRKAKLCFNAVVANGRPTLNFTIDGVWRESHWPEVFLGENRVEINLPLNPRNGEYRINFGPPGSLTPISGGDVNALPPVEVLIEDLKLIFD